MSAKREAIRIEIAEGVATATIDLPPMNLLGAELLGALHELVERMEQEPAARVLILRSADPEFFIAHGDVEVIVDVPTDPQPEAETLPFTHQVLQRLRRLPQVSIAQIEGYARGGGSEVALACDMRFAARGRAVLAQPEVPLGILPGAGGTVRLTHLVGPARATEIILGADDFNADEAVAYGWVNRALEPDALAPFVERLARRIASFPAATIIRAKRTIQTIAEADLERDLLTEQRAFDQLMSDTASERVQRMRRFLDRGVQTREGERTLAEACTALGEQH
jgi:enoyl-CoA hydratase/carnithine racemase